MTLHDSQRAQQRRNNQQGVTLIEMLLSIGILGIVIAGAATLVDNHLERTRSAATAQHMKIFADAAQAYIKDNYLDLTQANTHSVPTATPSIPAVITVSTLQTTPTGLPSGTPSATRYLPANYNPVNAYGQTICALVLQPKANELYGLVVTEGGNDIDDFNLGLLAGTIGASGGAIYTAASPTTLAKGTMGKWQFNLNSDPVGRFFQNRSARHCNGSLGPVNLRPGRPLIALWYSQDTSSAFLYRDKVPGHPELSTMQFDLRFKDDQKDITGHITSPGASLTLQVVRTADTLCDATPTSWTDKDTFTGLNTVVPPGTLARDKDGNLMMCAVYPTTEGGDGKRYWRTVAKAMYWGTPVNRYNNLPPCSSTQNAYQTRIVKEPASQLIPTIASKPRAYTCYPKLFGGEWQPLGVDNQGVLTTDRLKLGTRVEGQACQDPVGSLAQDIDGSILVCAWNHRWTKSKSTGRYSFQITQAVGMADPFGNRSGGHFIGTGYMAPDGKFSGALYCDGKYYGTQTCGSGGVIDAHSNGMAAFGAAFRGMRAGWWGWFIDQFNKPMMVEVANLQVFNVIREW